VEEPTPAHDETSPGATSPTGGRPGEYTSSTPSKPDGGHSGSEPPASDPTPPKLEVLVKKEKRSNEFWLALASIIAALVVGAIAAGSGWYTANQHDEQETLRQKVSSPQLQQKEAYASFINSASDLAIAIQLQVKAIENRYPYFLHSPIPEGKAHVEARFTDFGHALDVAQLYGSARVRDASNKVFDAADEVVLAHDEVDHSFSVARYDQDVYVDSPRGPVHLVALPRFPEPGSAVEKGSLVAPMPGNVIRLGAAVGDTVTSGQPLIWLEAMKMEHTITAPADGVLAELNVASGQQVEVGAVLARVEAPQDPEAKGDAG